MIFFSYITYPSQSGVSGHVAHRKSKNYVLRGVFLIQKATMRKWQSRVEANYVKKRGGKGKKK